MSAERDALLQYALTILHSARASCDAAAVLIGAAMADDEPPPDETEAETGNGWPASFGAAMSSTARPLTRERIRADLHRSRADATGAAFDPPTNTHAE